MRAFLAVDFPTVIGLGFVTHLSGGTPRLLTHGIAEYF
jgi:hypothetical protein